MDEPKQNRPAGFLEGKVTIGPVYPHERLGVPNEAAPEVYLAHRVAILAQDGLTKIKEVSLDGKGYYKTELLPGMYVVDVTPHDIGIEGRGIIPQQVTIESGKTTTQDIEVDTGIR